MMDKQGWARLAERVRRLYLPPSGLPVFCASCEVDAATGLCNGCLRSLSEIMGWADLDEEGKHMVWARIQQRLFALRDAESAARRANANRKRVRPVSLPPEPEALPGPESPPHAAPGPDEPAEPGSSMAPIHAEGAASSEESEAVPDAVPDAAPDQETGVAPVSEAPPAEPPPEAPVEPVAAVPAAAPAVPEAGETRADPAHADAAKPGEAEIRLQPLI